MTWRHRDTKTQKHGDTEMKRHGDNIETERYREIQRHDDKEIGDDIKTRLLSHKNSVWPSVPQTSSIETPEEPRAKQVALLS